MNTDVQEYYKRRKDRIDIASFRARRSKRLDGGPGSGNFGHDGRPGYGEITFVKAKGSDSRSDADEPKSWITVNGTHIPLDENGEMMGAVGKKISGGGKSAPSAKPSAKDISPAMKPKNTGYDFSLDDDEDDFIRKNTGNRRNPTPLYTLFHETEAAGGDGSAAIDAEFYKSRLAACSTDLKEIDQDEADEILSDNLRQGTVDAWFREYNHEAKAGLVWQLTRSPETHNAALNTMFTNYIEFCAAHDLEYPKSYEDFLVTPVKMYRGGSGEEYKEAGVFSSYTFDKDIAKGFTGSPQGHSFSPLGTVYEAEIRPIDTYGSVFHTAELEVLVPSYIAPNGNKDSADNRLDADRAIHLYEEIKKRHEGRKAVKAYKERRRARMDEEEPKAWITTETGVHIPLDENGQAIGGPLKGEDFSGAKSEKSTASSPKMARASRESRPVKQGKDISSTYQRRADKFQFEIEDVMDQQGFNGKPIVVSKGEFEKAVKEANGGKGFIAQRTYSAPDQETLDAYREALYDGDWYVDCSTGGAQYGQGMYCAADYNGELSDGIKEEMEHYREIRDRTLTGNEAKEIAREKELARVRAVAKEKLFDRFHPYVDGYDFTQGKWKPEFVEEAKGLKENNPELYDKIFTKIKEFESEYDNATYKIKRMSVDEISAEYKIDTRVDVPDFTETFTLSPDAKIVDYEEIHRMRLDEITGLKKAARDSAGHELIDAMNLKDGERDYVLWGLNISKEIEPMSLEKAMDYGKTLSAEAKNEYKDMRGRIEKVIQREIASSNVKTLEDMDEGAYAAMKGYDAINAEGHGNSGSYTVVLNRTKCIFLEPEGWNK